jgi:hypothetical protein
MTENYKYQIDNWNPINTDSFNLLVKINIKPDIKLLELFKIAPLRNILCKVSGTDNENYHQLTYGKIDKSDTDDSYYITLDTVWNSYPTPGKLGEITFYPETVYKTIDYISKKDASPIVNINNQPLPTLNLLYNSNETNNEVKSKEDSNEKSNEKYNEKSNDVSASLTYPPLQFCSSNRMKLQDIIIPIGISLILIGLLSYGLPKKLFN